MIFAASGGVIMNKGHMHAKVGIGPIVRAFPNDCQ